MINGVGSASPTRIGQVKGEKLEAATPVSPAAAATDSPAATPSLVAALAEAGPPINDEKIRAIRQAIAAGAYPIDVKAIAARMIALDLSKAIA